VITAIDLDDEAAGGSEKINDALTDNDLPPERDAKLGANEGVPELGFSERGLSAHRSSAISEKLRASRAERALWHRDLQRRQKRPGAATPSAACVTRGSEAATPVARAARKVRVMRSPAASAGVASDVADARLFVAMSLHAYGERLSVAVCNSEKGNPRLMQ